ncbi:MAG: hypothetical protein WAU78_12945 [Roseiarcus sp.]
MIYLANSLAALSILSLVVFIGSVFALFVKSARRIAKWLALAGFVGFFAAGFASLPFFERAAHEAGYSDFASQTRAERAAAEDTERKRSEELARKAAEDVENSAKRPAVKGEDDQATSDPEGNRKLAVTALAVALKRGLNDPDSMEWNLVTANDDGSIVCAEFRARNVFNALIVKKLAVVDGNRPRTHQFGTAAARANRNTI